MGIGYPYPYPSLLESTLARKAFRLSQNSSPQAGVTEWAKFLRFSIGARDYLSLPHYKADLNAFLLGNLERSRAMAMLEDPSWTKAVIFRNPLERLVSAYQDKIVRKRYTQKIFKIGSLTDENRTVLSFSEFVDKVTSSASDGIHSNCTYPHGLSACTDPHWKPQLMMCGLDYFLPKFDFVGNFDFVAEHTKALLEKVGVWDTWGRNFGDGGKGGEGATAGTICSMPPPPERNPTNDIGGTYGFNQRGPSTTAQYVHQTDSRTKMDELYTPELIEKVRQAYALDFAVWDEITKKPISEISYGKDLNAVREYCSTRNAS